TSQQLSTAQIAPQIADILKTLDQIRQQSAAPLAGHMQQLSQRLMAPLLARLGMNEELNQRFPCSKTVDSSDPDRALLCAELQLFPGGTPEDLGHSVRPLLTTPNSTIADYAGSPYMDTIAYWHKARLPSGAQWLAAAKNGYLAQHNARGLARVQLV